MRHPVISNPPWSEGYYVSPGLPEASPPARPYRAPAPSVRWAGTHTRKGSTRLLRAHCPPNYQCDRYVIPNPQETRQVPIPGHQSQAVPVNSEDTRVSRAADPRGVLGDHVHDRLEIRRRARDDPQDVARRRLLLERLGSLSSEPFDLTLQIGV